MFASGLSTTLNIHHGWAWVVIIGNGCGNCGHYWLGNRRKRRYRSNFLYSSYRLCGYNCCYRKNSIEWFEF